MTRSHKNAATGIEKKVRWSEEYRRKVVVPEDVERLCDLLRSDGKKITTLNGSFDLLHAGHLQIIYEASLQGDVLMVALNSDASIRNYKGPTRPIIPLQYRMEMMAALEFVDYITWFEETDPLRILAEIKPDVHVNGAEYGENCIEADIVKKFGGRIHIVNLVPGLSTTSILKKIQSLPS
jgi:rfaE bifunctional protein nucleotidyltransferase chain/domain